MMLLKTKSSFLLLYLLHSILTFQSSLASEHAGDVEHGEHDEHGGHGGHGEKGERDYLKPVTIIVGAHYHVHVHTLDYNQSCTLTKITGHRTLHNRTRIPYEVYKDPCNVPSARKFMHCNPLTKRCECYRDWGELTPEPNYNNTNDPMWATSDSLWFFYTQPKGFEKSESECVIRKDKRCGKRGEPMPYLCEDSRCGITLDEDDTVTYICKGSSLQPMGTVISMATALGVIVITVRSLMSSMIA